MQYNYMDDSYQAGTEGLKYAAERGLGIVVMEPLRGGKLAANVPGGVTDILNQASVKRTPAELALRWVWNHPEVSLLLSGMNTMEQLEENLKSANEGKANSLTAEDLNTVEKVKAFFRKNKS
jgi:predicted aldo/keto reductase-like oxidoreductase